MIILGIILVAISIVLVVIEMIGEVTDWDCSKTAIGWFAGGLFVLGLVSISYQKSHKITPMDVYQGKTTLQYIVVDSVKVDSVVVWKMKED